MVIKRYSDLKCLSTYTERYEYLKLKGKTAIFNDTVNRAINQAFYRSFEWKRVRDIVIVRDNGCDLGIPGYDIHSGLYVHHMNPIDTYALVHGDENVLDPEYLITVTHETHNAIHYGLENRPSREFTVRRPGDTRLW